MPRSQVDKSFDHIATAGTPTDETEQDRFSYLFRVGDRVVNFEVVASPAPLDPAAWPGWRVDRTCVGWRAVRAW